MPEWNVVERANPVCLLYNVTVSSGNSSLFMLGMICLGEEANFIFKRLKLVTIKTCLVIQGITST